MEASQILLPLFEDTGGQLLLAYLRLIGICRVHEIALQLYLSSLKEDISESLEFIMFDL